MHFCTHSNPYFGNYNNHLPIDHTLTIYKVHENMEVLLAYKSDDNMGLGSIFHNMCMCMVVEVVMEVVVVMVVVMVVVKVEVEVVKVEVEVEVEVKVEVEVEAA
jgi:hypothetical protein